MTTSGWMTTTDTKIQASVGSKSKRSRPDPEYYVAAAEHANSGLLITYGIKSPRKMVVRVTLTSAFLKEDAVAQRKEKENKSKDEPAVKKSKGENGEATEEKAEEKDNVTGGWAAVKLMPTEEDKANFKFGPYNATMSLEDCEIIEKEEGPLPSQPGLGALAELRRVKWFQSIGQETPYLPDICRLIRGLAIRESSWRAFRILCPWTIALILEQMIKYDMEENGGTPVTLSPARVMNNMLEAIGKGFRFPVLEKIKAESVEDLIGEVKKKEKRYTHKLVDPCETETDYDALSHINSMRKGDIRACAKYALDLIQRNQMCLLLNTPRMDETL